MFLRNDATLATGTEKRLLETFCSGIGDLWVLLGPQYFAQGSKISKGGGCSGLASPTPVSVPSPPHHRPLEAEGGWLGGVLVASASQEKARSLPLLSQTQFTSQGPKRCLDS